MNEYMIYKHNNSQQLIVASGDDMMRSERLDILMLKELPSHTLFN